MNARLQAQALLHDGHQHIHRDRGPELSFHGIFAIPVKCFYPEVLFDPFEEQLDLPAGLVEQTDSECREVEIVSQEDQCTLLFRIVIADPDSVSAMPE